MRVRKNPMIPLAAVAAGLLAGAVGTVCLDAVHYLQYRPPPADHPSALPDTRLAEMNQVAATTGDELELDTLILARRRRFGGITASIIPLSLSPGISAMALLTFGLHR